MMSYDEYMADNPHPLDTMDLKDIAAHLHGCPLEDFYRYKYEFQPLPVVLDELIEDLYNGFAGLEILRLLIERAMQIEPDETRREVEAAMAKFNNKGVTNAK